MKAMLFFPPNWTPTMPHLALPTLTAFLRGHGVEVIQRDLNIEVFDTVLSREHLEGVLVRLRNDYGRYGERRPRGRRIVAPIDQVRMALSQGPQIAARVEQAKALMRSNAFFDGPIGLHAFETIIDALQIASLPFSPAALEVGTYRPAATADSSTSILHEVRDPQVNMLLELYRRDVLPDIMREQPDVVGISIPSMAQMVPGLTLAALIKDAGLGCHITIGGPHITMLRDRLIASPAIFSIIDSAVVFDGEVPLLRLIEAVAAGNPIDTVPNLIYCRDGVAHATERKVPEKIGALPLPDFDGLPLDRYLAPQLTLPLMTARGCYYGKCAFCNVGYGEAETFSLMRSEILADQMMTLKKRYGVEQIFFSDEALTPRTLRELSKIMERDGVPLLWGGCARFERPITAELLQQMYAGGCRMILFGLESAAEPVMQRMAKGTQLEHMHRILGESTAAGIWNHTFFFFGFPGETLEDAQATVNFLYEHKLHINSAAFGTFLLEIDAPAHRFAESFGITRVIDPPEKDLAIYFEYETASGMDSAFADHVAERFLESLPEKPYPQFYVNDVCRFLYACHLSRLGEAPPPWLVPQDTATVG
ncbi:MAG TPA: radical SAM protein [Roseiflexaceae bacterium]|nr:radical SAM protein [Roseiflexaceae bacterium]